MDKSAYISLCRQYRYYLTRTWGPGPKAMFVGLNPGMDDPETDDLAVRRCVNFAKRWGYGGMIMVNLFSFRASETIDMMVADDPIGPLTDNTILTLLPMVGIVVCVWGPHGGRFGRDRKVIDLLLGLGGVKPLYVLGRNSDGSPKTPLYLSAQTLPEPWELPYCN